MVSCTTVMGTTKGKFLFVNKTESSAWLSKSDKSEKSTIQHHVQTGRSRRRAVKSSREKPWTTMVFEAVRQTHAAEIINDQPVKWNAIARKKHGHQKTRHDLAGPVRSTHASHLLGNGSHAPIYHNIGITQDPFRSTPIPLDATAHGLLRYYVNYYHPVLWPNELAVLKRGTYVFYGNMQSIMQLAYSNRLAMYCLLGAAACRLQYVDHQPLAEVAKREEQYLTTALRLMIPALDISNLDHQQFQMIIVCMMFMTSAESYRGNTTTAKMHLQAIQRALEPKGGLSYFKDDNIRGQLAMADLFLACVKLEPCLFSCEYDPGPADTLNLNPEELLPQTPTRFATALLEQSRCFIKPRLKALIQRLQESYTLRVRFMMNSVSPERALQVAHWLTLRHMALRHGLLAITSVDARVHALRVALIMWSLFAMNIIGRTKTVKIMAPTLRTILLSLDDEAWSCCGDIQLWILLVGLQCATKGSDTAQWFHEEVNKHIDEHVANSCAHMGLEERARAVERFQNQFFFDVRTQRPLARMLAAEVVGVTQACDEDRRR